MQTNNSKKTLFAVCWPYASRIGAVYLPYKVRINSVSPPYHTRITPVLSPYTKFKSGDFFPELFRIGLRKMALKNQGNTFAKTIKTHFTPRINLLISVSGKELEMPSNNLFSIIKKRT
jgi:hypothetical protein